MAAIGSKESFKALARRAGMCAASTLTKAGAEPLRMDSGSMLGGARRQLLECVCAGASVGGQTLMESLLRENLREGGFAALVDLHQALDFETLWPGAERNLLWVRCRNPLQAVKCLDLLLRDENFTQVLADFRGMAGRHLDGVPPNTWYRLQRLAHQREGGCWIFTDGPRIRAADARWILEQPREASDFWSTRGDLSASLTGRIQVERGGVRQGANVRAG